MEILVQTASANTLRNLAMAAWEGDLLQAIMLLHRRTLEHWECVSGEGASPS